MADIENAKDTASPDSQNSKNGEDKGDDIEVHSANAWEKADLGDDDRKNKFLRLMGAGKKEHHGRFVIGDHNPEHGRKKDETEQLQHQLEDQYTQSMQHRLAGGRHGHVGLGFHDADLDAKDTTADKEESCDTKDEDKEEEAEAETEGAVGGDDTSGDSAESKGKDSEGDGEREKVSSPSRKRVSEGGGDSKEEGGSPAEKKMKFVKSSS